MTSENKNLTPDEKERDEALAEEKKPGKLRSLIIEISVYVVIAFVAIFIIPKYVIGRVPVSGPSMENTLRDGDQLLGELITTYTENYERYDIIFFHPHGRESDDIYIKRIIGLPYESVRIDYDGTIYVNGVPLDE
ncbi:MAG: signal peptidase I, partial [Lachnospiraceae bacterium]|nr:signal peptidase I [Lachnospiraceae bacterium]